MNENTSCERFVIEAFGREGSGRPVPAAIHDELISRAGRKRQWPAWLASIKEPPMRISNSLAVGSPTVRVVAVVAATLLLALLLAAVGVAGSRLLAADDVIVVDQAGGGDFTTIAEAVAVAEDGDTVLVKPGVYSESVTITRSIELRGEDPAETIVQAGADCVFDEEADATTCEPGVPLYDGFWYEPSPYGLLLDDTDAHVRDLGFRFEGTGVSGIVVNGGAPVISGVVYDTDDAINNVYIHGGSAATVRDSDFNEVYLLVLERSPVTVEGSHFGVIDVNTGDVPSGSGGPATIRNNRAAAIIFDGSALVEGNEVSYPAADGEFDAVIEVQGGEGWVIRDNVVRDSTSDFGAIAAGPPSGAGEITGNTLANNDVGMSVSNDSLVEGNTITDGTVGIIVAGGSPELIDNSVEGLEGVGISIGMARPSLSDNRSCGNGTDLRILARANPVIDDSNEFCVVEDLRTD